VDAFKILVAVREIMETVHPNAVAQRDQLMNEYCRLRMEMGICHLEHEQLVAKVCPFFVLLQNELVNVMRTLEERIRASRCTRDIVFPPNTSIPDASYFQCFQDNAHSRPKTPSEALDGLERLKQQSSLTASNSIGCGIENASRLTLDAAIVAIEAVRAYGGAPGISPVAVDRLYEMARCLNELHGQLQRPSGNILSRTRQFALNAATLCKIRGEFNRFKKISWSTELFS
jgi:hypothetical protein